jgi:methylated-DNA-[protein]-cysteine S-methyltransferase
MSTEPHREHYVLFDTPIGVCAIAWSERGVTRVQLPERNREASEQRLLKRSPDATPAEPPPHIAGVIAAIERYADGEAVDFSDVALDVDAAEPFHRAVYDAARAVKWGETTTYGALGAKAGSQGDAREVGVALSRNPVTIIIPCHRVLAAGNKMGGFSAYGGTVTKERLLALEGVTVGEPVLPGLFETALPVKHHPLRGALKSVTHIDPEVDLTEPADPSWGERWSRSN